MAARKHYLLRIDPELWSDIERWAANELRSVNAQVEWILRDAVRRHRRGQGLETAGDGEAGPRPAPPDTGGRGETARPHQDSRGGGDGEAAPGA